MKYYRKGSEVFAFENDGSQDDYITQDMVRMTSSEVDKHLNPKKYMTDETKVTPGHRVLRVKSAPKARKARKARREKRVMPERRATRVT